MMGRIFSSLAGNISGVLPDDYFTHYMHCVDYLRQAVACAGDMAMEPHLPTDGPDNGPLDGGWNGMHGMELPSLGRRRASALVLKWILI